MAIARSNIASQMKGSSRMRFRSTGDDAKDLAVIRAAKNIDDGPVSMKKGGKVKKKSKSRVNEAGNYTKPGMRKRLFNRIKAGSKGGNPGQWSARKAQMLASAYKKAGGGYKN
jgi:hypothetical protein|tara:strand:- start:1194 stop:1532 length:339 start_codon:yes stop_codon:yes gene_type:complete